MNAQRLTSTVILVVAALATMPACAQPGRRMGPQSEGIDREQVMRFQPYHGQGRQGGANPDQAQAAPMTLEERRQLRRDIHEAGRELYRQHHRRARAAETAPAASR